MDDLISPVYCPQCRKVIPADADYCTYCGAAASTVVRMTEGRGGQESSPQQTQQSVVRASSRIKIALVCGLILITALGIGLHFRPQHTQKPSPVPSKPPQSFQADGASPIIEGHEYGRPDAYQAPFGASQPQRIVPCPAITNSLNRLEYLLDQKEQLDAKAKIRDIKERMENLSEMDVQPGISLLDITTNLSETIIALLQRELELTKQYGDELGRLSRLPGVSRPSPDCLMTSSQVQRAWEILERSEHLAREHY